MLGPAVVLAEHERLGKCKFAYDRVVVEARAQARPEDQPAGADGCAPASEALSAAFGLLGKRWNGMIIGRLADGATGFASLRRGIGGITDSMLSDRLSELAAAGLVDRSVTDTRPPTVSYRLTDAGHALLPVLHQLASWAREHLPARCSGDAGACGPTGC